MLVVSVRSHDIEGRQSSLHHLSCDSCAKCDKSNTHVHDCRAYSNECTLLRVSYLYNIIFNLCQPLNIIEYILNLSVALYIFVFCI